jgi:NAD+ kinase
MAFSIGGDGTFIKTVGFIRDSGVPIVGINTGRLGFLANINRLNRKMLSSRFITKSKWCFC